MGGSGVGPMSPEDHHRLSGLTEREGRAAIGCPRLAHHGRGCTGDPAAGRVVDGWRRSLGSLRVDGLPTEFILSSKPQKSRLDGRRGSWVRLTITDEWIEVRRRWRWSPNAVVPTSPLRTTAADVEVVFGDCRRSRNPAAGRFGVRVIPQSVVHVFPHLVRGVGVHPSGSLYL